MQKILFLFAFTLLLFRSGYSQSTPEMVLVKGGTTLIGGGYQYEIRDDRIHYLGHDLEFDSLNLESRALGEEPAPNNPPMQVTVADFYMSPTEVTNGEYLAFLIDSLLSDADKNKLQKLLKSGKSSDQDAIAEKLTLVYKEAGQTALMPDLEIRTSGLGYSFGEPLNSDYFKHPAYADYPVVGVTWFQAKVYCAWLSRANNAERARKNLPKQPNFRLPTEVEWEYAARGIVPQPIDEQKVGKKNDRRLIKYIYPWPGRHFYDEEASYRANIKFVKNFYGNDGYTFTAPVKSFSPNGFGLYDMAGNVSEWVEDVFRINKFPLADARIEPGYGGIDVRKNPRVIKGGSWADNYFAAMCGSRSGIYQDQSSARVGFRVVRNWEEGASR